MYAASTKKLVAIVAVFCAPLFCKGGDDDTPQGGYFTGFDPSGRRHTEHVPPDEFPEKYVNRDAPRSDFGWSTPPSVQCGANALFLFMRAHGALVSRAEIIAAVPTTAQGSSMGDLAAAAQAHDVAADVYETSPSALSDFRFPLIARMSADNSELAHYVLVTYVRGDEVGLIDGSTGASIQATRASFDRDFTGFILGLPKSTRLGIWALGSLILIEIGLLILVKRR